MKTQVVMRRELFGSKIEQQSKTGFFNANQLVHAGNKFRIMNNLPMFRLQDWLNLPSTKEFIRELENNLGEKVKSATRGRKASTWIHPYLFIDLALYISPKLKIEVYSWLYDELLKHRNLSGESYKKMTGALWENTKDKTNFHKLIKQIANTIKNDCNVKDWETATEKQLKLRDRIHENIALLCDVLKDNNQATQIGISKAINSLRS